MPLRPDQVGMRGSSQVLLAFAMAGFLVGCADSERSQTLEPAAQSENVAPSVMIKPPEEIAAPQVVVTDLMPTEAAPWNGTASMDYFEEGVTVTDNSAERYDVIARLLGDIDLEDTVTVTARIVLLGSTEHSSIRFGYTAADGSSVKNDVGLKHDTSSVSLIRGEANITSESAGNAVMLDILFDVPEDSTDHYIEIYPAASVSDFAESTEGMTSIRIEELTIQ